jgi:hypothetical protein
MTPRQLANGQIREVIDLAVLQQRSEVPVPIDSVRLILCGNGKVGKTTFSRAVLRSTFSASLSSLSNPKNERTHGFSVQQVTIPDGVGKCTLIDFAGQPEYWVSHGLLMQSEASVFLVMCNLGDPAAKQRTQLYYWLRFIASTAQDGVKPVVAMVRTRVCNGWRDLNAHISRPHGRRSVVSDTTETNTSGDHALRFCLLYVCYTFATFTLIVITFTNACDHRLGPTVAKRHRMTKEQTC